MSCARRTPASRRLREAGSPAEDEAEDVGRTVTSRIIEQGARGGDAEVLACVKKFDGAHARHLEVQPEEWEEAGELIDPADRAALGKAAMRVREFHRKRIPSSWEVREEGGGVFGHRVRPLHAVGIYVPGRQGRVSLVRDHERGAGLGGRGAGDRDGHASRPGRKHQARGADRGEGGGRAPHLQDGRRPRGGRAGLRHRERAARSTRSPGPGTSTSPRPSAWSSARCRSTARRAPPR